MQLTSPKSHVVSALHQNMNPSHKGETFALFNVAEKGSFHFRSGLLFSLRPLKSTTRYIFVTEPSCT